MEPMEILGWIWTGLVIAGIIASVVALFFAEIKKSKLPSRKPTAYKRKLPKFKETYYEDDEREDRTFSQSFWGSSKPKKHSGKCDGDCANCPPHYGYRYGRWYYGHNHIEGCEFGGNKGSGGRD